MPTRSLLIREGSQEVSEGWIPRSQRDSTKESWEPSRLVAPSRPRLQSGADFAITRATSEFFLV